jgi:pyridoxine 5-phosphate synthase|tara:strand:+ start:26838 stop:27602 length:765 start_codon:yes stop_codon:yes gene_type:complete
MSAKRPILLGVNIDHCATVRQARYRDYPRLRGEVVEPDPLAFAIAAERAGADGITVHPREDGRHIQQGDVSAIRECIQVPLNLEMAATDAMVAFALEIKPRTVCLVPEKREELTTEGGLDVVGQKERLRGVVASMTEAGIETSLFIDPDPAQIDTAVEIGAPIIELHTGTYANSYYELEKRQAELKTLREGAAQAHAAGLVVNLGHGINYVNVAEMREVPWIHEMNIGHTIVARALFDGLEKAVRDMKALMNPA